MGRTRKKREKDAIRATLRFTRISPFKARRVADVIRGKSIEEALATLKFMPQKASFIFEKMIKSALANAAQLENPPDEEELYLQKILVDEGPTLHRIQFRAQGRVYRIRKRTSHIHIVLKEQSNILSGKAGKAA